MSALSGSAVRSGRIGAAVLLLLAAAYGVGGSRIEYAFASDSLGPRVFPVALSIVLAFLSVLYFLKPGSAEPWPRGPELASAVAIPALVALAAVLLEWLGFPIVVLIMTAGIGRIFGAGWGKALGAGLVHATLWYLVFGYLLGLQVPIGSLFGP